MAENEPWVTCFLTHILITYIEEAFQGKGAIDYPGLFEGAEGFDTPSDPEIFLREGDNWVPLSVFTKLLAQCEKISAQKDVSYHAAKSFFDPARKQLPSLFEIIVRVLNNLRSAFLFISSSLWESVQTNFIRLQSFEGQGSEPALFMLAQFSEGAKPTVGAVYFLRGMAEGFPRLYPFVDEIQCIEEISQLSIRAIVQEFPDYRAVSEGDRLFVCHESSRVPAVEARKVALRLESLPVSREFLAKLPEDSVVTPKNGRIDVLTDREEEDPTSGKSIAWAYQIVRPGELYQESLSYSFKKGGIYDAPYSRLRLVSKQGLLPRVEEDPDEEIRKEISHLIYEHLRGIKQTQTRIMQYNQDKWRLTRENLRLRDEIEREFGFAGIVGESPKMKEVFRSVRSIAETDMTVIIQGETGTGKELIARAIHYTGPRKTSRYVAVNCAALSETLLDSELFGHEKGAFTGAATQRRGLFEVADGGTLFLDEIGEIPLSTQIKLLRVLQEGEFQRVGASESRRVDVRIITATNQDLEELLEKGKFRKDLYFRLNVFLIQVPPLRNRSEDVPLLVAHFIEKRRLRLRKQIRVASSEALALLTAYDWPGNVRELENVVQRMMVVARGGILELEDLPPEICGTRDGSKETTKDLKYMIRESSEVVERHAILETLDQTHGNVTRAAEVLGISRATLQNKMKTYGIRPNKRESSA